MPGRDGSGPLGEGPLTGRGLGPCGRGLARGRGFGRGFGRGLGLGRGLGWRARFAWDYPTEPVELSKEEEKKILEAEKQEIEKRLKELE
ncbi:hypothetical protein AYK26_06710 [Euryarchaeota archaeon SM23-78]|nr:MAG: hypothetical protein AYK26_06710 [Euryarchaeota archaeon SM23-78]MBW3001191.1 DUF5320 domain-containing protein [Candidatus Woesearchaeota archaeon]